MHKARPIIHIAIVRGDQALYLEGASRIVLSIAEPLICVMGNAWRSGDMWRLYLV